MSRAREPGYRLAAMNDPSGRRGIWYRENDESIEVCGGREGDDSYVKLVVGATFSATTLRDLVVASFE